MKGLEIAEKYFNEFGYPMLKSDFPELLPLLCAGLVGSGSECYGFDDEISKDHDFEPGFCIFIPGEDVIDRKTAFNLERAYAKLPKEFMGLKRGLINPVGGSRHGVIRISDFYSSKLGKNFENFTADDWFSIPEYSLFEAVNGKVFLDNYGAFSKIRDEFSAFPVDIRLKKLAGNLLLMGQSGQYNFGRCLSHGEPAAAQLALFDFVKSGLNTVFLINNSYMPYYKWSFKALKNLKRLSSLSDSFEYLITADNSEHKLKTQIIEDIASIILNELIDLEIIGDRVLEFEGMAYAVNSGIKDPNIRNLNILYGV